MAVAMSHSAHPTLPSSTGAASSAPAVVLDTNVVLDWLVFNDPICALLATRLQARDLIWHATSAMRRELTSVLPRPQLASWRPDCEHILSVFDLWALISIDAPSALGTMSPRCRDPDDQKFIDLALSLGARWLFSRDRALLDLAKAARARGLEILTPAQWQRLYPAGLDIKLVTTTA